MTAQATTKTGIRNTPLILTFLIIAAALITYSFVSTLVDMIRNLKLIAAISSRQTVGQVPSAPASSILAYVFNYIFALASDAFLLFACVFAAVRVGSERRTLYPSMSVVWSCLGVSFWFNVLSRLLVFGMDAYYYSGVHLQITLFYLICDMICAVLCMIPEIDPIPKKQTVVLIFLLSFLGLRFLLSAATIILLFSESIAVPWSTILNSVLWATGNSLLFAAFLILVRRSKALFFPETALPFSGSEPGSAAMSPEEELALLDKKLVAGQYTPDEYMRLRAEILSRL
ncbi:MAG: hypothetical protein IKQ92_05980 [Clostridia bacterium]|nr:hypothetical protein [Clostridia bacterium]